MTPGRSTPGATAAGRRSWLDRLDDPDEPLYTVAIAADLFGVDPQTLRRLSDAIEQQAERPSGNQRRYSRTEVERMGRTFELVGDGHNPSSANRIRDLEDQLAAARDRPA